MEEVAEMDPSRETAAHGIQERQGAEMKAIELVARAQPMITALRAAARRCDDNPKKNVLIADCDEWLNHAGQLLNKKGKVEK